MINGRRGGSRQRSMRYREGRLKVSLPIADYKTEISSNGHPIREAKYRQSAENPVLIPLGHPAPKMKEAGRDDRSKRSIFYGAACVHTITIMERLRLAAMMPHAR